MSKQPIYNELKRMLKKGEITDQEYGLAIEKTDTEPAWWKALANIGGRGDFYPGLLQSANVIAQKISPTEAIVITRPYTNQAQYYYYFHMEPSSNR